MPLFEMKTWIALLLLAALPAVGQTELERTDPSDGPQSKEKPNSEKRLNEIKPTKTAEPVRAAQFDDLDNHRIVEGKLYNVALAINFITLPADGQRGRFLRRTPDGPAFELEDQQLYRGDWLFSRLVVVTNYPGHPRMPGEFMLTIRALPVRTNDFFDPPVAVYDCGTPSKTATNAVAPLTAGKK
jgi:hypothetical protein